MSWDVVLFSSKEKIISLEAFDEEMLFPVDFDAGLLSHFKNVTQDKNHISVNGEGFSIDFFLDEDPESNKMLSLYGEKALFALVIVAKAQGWQIYDSGVDAMIDLDNPSANGYKNFKEYLNTVLKGME